MPDNNETTTEEATEEVNTTTSEEREGGGSNNRIGQMIGLAFVVMLGLLVGGWLLSQDLSCSGSSSSDSVASADEEETEIDEDPAPADGQVEYSSTSTVNCRVPSNLRSTYGGYEQAICAGSALDARRYCRGLDGYTDRMRCQRAALCLVGDGQYIAAGCWDDVR